METINCLAYIPPGCIKRRVAVTDWQRLGSSPSDSSHVLFVALPHFFPREASFGQDTNDPFHQRVTSPQYRILQQSILKKEKNTKFTGLPLHKQESYSCSWHLHIQNSHESSSASCSQPAQRVARTVIKHRGLHRWIYPVATCEPTASAGKITTQTPGSRWKPTGSNRLVEKCRYKGHGFIP